MFVPSIVARVEQTGDLSRFGINPRNVRAFVQIAWQTGQRQIPGLRQTTVLLSDNVVDLKQRVVELLRNAAVFTARFGPLPYQQLEPLLHGSRFAVTGTKRSPGFGLENA
jgi:hypothetical protein